ncbi:MAG: transposase [Terriglobales bacterium]|jgi:putative transposase
MPWGLTRFHHSGQSHFVTFCCYHRRRLFTTDASRRIFESALERVRRSFRLQVYGYVVMPEHVHLLLSEPQRDTSSDRTAPLKPKDGLNGPPVPKPGLSGPPVLLSEPRQDTLADALKSLKQGVSRRLIGKLPLKPKPGLSGAPEHFWQKRYYDFNIRNYPQFVEKLRYLHRNPVKAGLCERPEDWEWSSFRHYATGCEGRVEIESEWTARKREREAGRLCPAVELPHSSQKQA